jgi:hypothetical protein
MMKRSNRSTTASEKTTAESPNPRDKKQNRSESTPEGMKTKESETTELDKELENHTGSDKSIEQNLIHKFTTALASKDTSAESKPGDVCGGQALWANLVSPAKSTWTAIEANTRKAQKAYKLEDKFREGSYSLHNLAATGKNYKRMGLKETLLAEGWKLLFTDLFEKTIDLSGTEIGDSLCMFGLRLAKTPPKDIFDGADWVQDNDNDKCKGLQSSMITEAWTGAYMYFGAPWKRTATFADYLSDSKKPAMKHGPKFDLNQDMEIISSDEDDELTPTTVLKDNREPRSKSIVFERQMFIKKEKSKIATPQTGKKKKWNESRKFKTFLKIKTSTLKKPDRMDQESEFLEIMQDTLTKLWTIDPKLVVYPWKEENDGGKPIQSGKVFPSNRDAFAEFTERVFLKRGMNVWIRLHVGHNKSLAALQDAKMIDHFRQKDMLAYKDNLQVKTTTKAGWLLGSHPTVLNPRDLEEALSLLPEMKGIPIEIRIDWVSIDKGDKLGLKAAYVLCEWENALLCRRTLNKIYGKTVDGYPLGRNMRFVPNTTDQRFITTQSTRKKVEASVRKQRLFVANVSSSVSYIISDLDYYEATTGNTLRQALMQMRSKAFPSRNLFLAVDTSWNTKFVSFLFKKDLAGEVNAMLPALPLVLQAKLGSEVWNWFNDDAQKNTAGYWWDPKRGVRAQGDDELDSWGDSMDSEDGNDDTGYWSSASTASGLSRASTKSKMEFEPFNLEKTSGKNEYDETDGDDKSIGDYSTVTTKGKMPSPDSTTDSSPSKLKSALRSTSSIDTSTTSPVSTLSPADSLLAQDTVLQRMREDPVYAKAMMAQFSFSPPAEPATASGLSEPGTPMNTSKSPPRVEGDGE